MHRAWQALPRSVPGPVGPHLTQRDPEDAIDRYEPRTTAAVRDSGELLPQGEIVQHQRLSREREGAKPPEGELEKEKHRRTMRASLCNGKRR